MTPELYLEPTPGAHIWSPQFIVGYEYLSEVETSAPKFTAPGNLASNGYIYFNSSNRDFIIFLNFGRLYLTISSII